MDGLNLWAGIAAGISIAACIAAAIAAAAARRRERRAYRQLNELLDRAMAGTFTEGSCDETALSALESKLRRYLAASLTSKRDLAEERNKVRTLISDISHQTKTPIANLLLYAQLLQEQPLPPEAAALTLELTAQAQKLSFLIQALVKASRLETGIIAVSPAPQPVLPLIEAAVEMLASKADEKRVALKRGCDAALTAVFDRKWTEEALINLVDNAVKYTPSGGSVAVTAVSYELFTRIDVADTGIGIDEREIPLIFQRFYRCPAVGAREGVGLGLYLAREIASAQGGYIKVKSAPQAGATFSLFLPKETRAILAKPLDL